MKRVGTRVEMKAVRTLPFENTLESWVECDHSRFFLYFLTFDKGRIFSAKSTMPGVLKIIGFLFRKNNVRSVSGENMVPKPSIKIQETSQAGWRLG